MPSRILDGSNGRSTNSHTLIKPHLFRVEELSQQVDQMSARCQEMEEVSCSAHFESFSLITRLK